MDFARSRRGVDRLPGWRRRLLPAARGELERTEDHGEVVIVALR
jgi:hypothetical protein